MHRPRTTESPINTTAITLPPDVASARKSRINDDLTTLFKRPYPLNSTPSAKGIGLYTHVSGPAKTPQFQVPYERYVRGEPEFLPLGGPRRVGERGGGVEAPLDEEVKAVWREVSEAVREEERVVGGRKIGAGELGKRYGPLDAVEGSVGAGMGQAEMGEVQQRVRREQDVVTQEHIAGPESTAIPTGPRAQIGDRRPSVGGITGRESEGAGDVAMSGMGSETTGSIVKSGTIYIASRDPRKQGR